jgi:galactosylceramidase
MSRIIALALACASVPAMAQNAGDGATAMSQHIVLNGHAGGKTFDGIGVVDGGGGTSVLLKDYPEPQRSQILDLLYKPRFGASVSGLYVEVPGDGNSTQGSMPSHMHERDDLNTSRGYTWWVMEEARRRNPALLLDGAAWSAPGWIGTQGTRYSSGKDPDAAFFSQDTVDYYVNWLRGAREHGLRMAALGIRNEKGWNYDFAKALRAGLDAGGFADVKLHGFDNWQDNKFDFVKDMATDDQLRRSLAIIGAHMNPPEYRVPADVRQAAERMGKPIWNTEGHVYKPGFDALIGIVQGFNDIHVHSGVTKMINWYGIAGLYEMEPYSGAKEAAVRANWPWSGHYEINPSLWGYAHYGQFTEAGWTYLNGADGDLRDGGTYVTLASPRHDYSMIVETADATKPQTVTVAVGGGLSRGPVAVWRSDAAEQFVRLPDVNPRDGTLTLTFSPKSVYSITTTRGQQKGGFDANSPLTRFPLPYRETFDGYSDPARWGYLPHYFADIGGAFELTSCPGRSGGCLRQVAPVPPLSWAPNWQAYTIIGDDRWTDYEVATDIHLSAGETGGIMGRINSVGTGYGYIPQGYLLTLAADGQVRLLVSRGKEDKKALVGDAEQQALIRAAHDTAPGGTAVLGEARVPAGSGVWHRLGLRFTGKSIVGSVDGKPVVTVLDGTYGYGMAGLLAGGNATRWSRPWFDQFSLTPTKSQAASAGPLAPRGPLYTGRRTAVQR